MADWWTMVAYVLAAWLGWQAMGRVRRRSQGAVSSRSLFWLVTAPLLVLLCVSKLFDLSSVVSALGRHLAMTEGWYVHRRTFQVFAIMGIGACGLWGLGYLAWRQRDSQERYLGALFAIAYLVGFVGVRAVSLHQVDAFLAMNVNGFSVNWLLENAGIACVIVAALYTGRGPLRPRESVPTRPQREIAVIRARRAHLAGSEGEVITAEDIARRQARRAAYREGLAAGTVSPDEGTARGSGNRG